MKWKNSSFRSRRSGNCDESAIAGVAIIARILTILEEVFALECRSFRQVHVAEESILTCSRPVDIERQGQSWSKGE